ncbi:MAG TPA: glycoside hydrolase family 2 TIM barrel-domain containing protein [Thermoguttaceae bacterium]|nr:glycoside hydrolase family 2 TIM barrel-domain containing protein [Thermoguttaceae bacterium]
MRWRYGVLVTVACVLAASAAAWAEETKKPAELPKPDVFTMPAANAGQRAEVPLAGVWEISACPEPEIMAHKPMPNRTGPVETLPPAAECRWTPFEVPGDKLKTMPGWNHIHRFAFRTTVRVPADLKGRSFILHIPCFNMIASVIVNGRYCGYSKMPFAIFDCDVTKAVKPGGANEIAVVIKDTWYALTGADKDAFIMTIPIDLISSHNQGAGLNFDFPVFTKPDAGILEKPSLIAAGPVYTSDVFAIPSVKRKELGLEVTVANPGAADVTMKIENEVVPLAGGKAEKKFAAKDLTVGAGKQETFKITAPWENPKLWWPDDPQQYHVVTKIVVNGAVVDTKRTKFGFREWEWNGPRFVLNGVPWQGRADLSYHGTDKPEEAVKAWREHGQTMMRLWTHEWGGMGQNEALDFFDSSGVPVRRSGVFDGEFASYNLWERPALWQNWRDQIKAQVRGERNHPSVFIWSLENEVTFINSRNLGKLQNSDPEIKRAAQELMAMDPTRPVMVDGGNALLDESLPVSGVHYNEFDGSDRRDYPDEAYTMERELARRNPWPIAPNKPIFYGESYFAVGQPPSWYAGIGGEEAFAGRAASSRAAG